MTLIEGLQRTFIKSYNKDHVLSNDFLLHILQTELEWRTSKIVQNYINWHISENMRLRREIEHQNDILSMDIEDYILNKELGQVDLKIAEKNENLAKEELQNEKEYREQVNYLFIMRGVA